MLLRDVAETLQLTARSCPDEMSRSVKGGYVSDLLSDVIANAKEGDIWITLQLHQNIVAVAFLNNLAGIVIVGGRQPDADTLSKSEEQGVPILTTPLSAYEVVGKLHDLGIHRQS